MDRITGIGYALDGSGRRVFVDQNLAAGVDGTDVNGVWLTGVQEEILTVVAAADIAPNIADNTLLEQAIAKLIADAVANAFAAAVSQINPAVQNRRPFPAYLYGYSLPHLTLAVGWYGFRLGGAGGGGGGTKQAQGGCGGGAGGNEIRGTFHVDAAGVYPFLCGTAGLGGLVGTNLGVNGLPGGGSSFVGVNVGGGGPGISADDPSASVGSGGTVTADPPSGPYPAGISYLTVYSVPGNDGGPGTGLDGGASNNSMAGNGGAGALGGAGRGGEAQGITAHGPGGGGGGAYTKGQTGASPGGSGGPGYLILETFATVTG